MSDCTTYEHTRRVVYECGEAIGSAQLVPVCAACGRFVKADATIMVSELGGLSKGPNATCAKCGRTRMRFEGFW